MTGIGEEQYWETWEFQEYSRKFTEHYARTMLWANTYSADEQDSEVRAEDWQTPSDNWGLSAFGSASQLSITADCEDFVLAQWPLLSDLDPAQSGHDFALTRNGHGAGFWDRGIGERGDILTAASHAYGTSSAWFGDAGIVHLDDE